LAAPFPWRRFRFRSDVHIHGIVENGFDEFAPFPGKVLDEQGPLFAVLDRIAKLFHLGAVVRCEPLEVVAYQFYPWQ
jgi:hypothetical protein